MSKDRKDFCWVRPKPEYGDARYCAGAFSVYCTQETPAEVTMGEWKVILEPLGIFEQCAAPEPKGE